MGQGRVVAAVAAAVILAAACSSKPAPQSQAALPTVTPQPMTKRELALRALASFDAKRYDEAVPQLTEAAHAYSEVAPFLRLRIVDAEVARNNVENAIAIASEIVALDENSAATVARLRLPALYAQLGDAAETDAAWQQAMLIAIDELTESDFVAMADAMAKAGRADLAAKTRMHLLNDYTQGRYTEQTYDLVKSDVAALPAADKLALAAKLAKSDRYDQALELIPAGAPEARPMRLRALFNSRHYDEILAETADANLDDPALVLLRARAAWRAGHGADFLAGLDRIEKDFPASAQATEAKVLRAKYYVTDEIDYARATASLASAIDAGALGTDGENLWNLGYTYTLWGKYDDALKTFERYIAAYPDGDWKTNSLFWSAKILDRLGRTQERDAKAAQIVAEYPYSYYAYRVKELWNVNAPQAASASFPDVEGELAKVVDPRFATVRALLDIQLNREAAREMKLVASRYEDNPGVQFMLADVYVRGGEPFKANGVLQRRFRNFVRHGGANIPQRFWQILFPLAYWDAIRAEGERRGVDPYLLASIIRQESGFEPSTVSNAGAVGLMQIMPEEASRIATAGGLDAVTREELFDPAKNIAVGAAEYAQKLAAMNGNPVLAIASYNAGERAVGTWLEKTPIDDLDLFVESIPFAETRLYVKTVSRNRFEYRRIYESSTASPEQRPTQ